MSARTLRGAGAVLALVALVATPAAAQDLQFTIAEGKVTLSARNVPLRDLLTLWSRLGQTRIVNLEKITAPPVTLELVGVPEAQALDILLRPVSGYMAAPRAMGQSGASAFDRILIMASSRPPAGRTTAVAPSPQPRVVTQRPGRNTVATEDAGDDEEPADEEDVDQMQQGQPRPGVIGAQVPGSLQVPMQIGPDGNPIPTPAGDYPTQGSVRPGIVITPPTPNRNPNARPPQQPPPPQP